MILQVLAVSEFFCYSTVQGCDEMDVFQKSGSENSLKRQIYNDIFNDILIGSPQLNTHITEKELVERFNVSKSPIREALIELCNEGVLRSIPRYGYEVIKIAERDVKDARELRIILECGALDRYWDTLTIDQVDVIEKRLEIPQTEVSVLDHWKSNSQFHLDLAATYNNKCLYKSLETSLKLMTRAYVQFQIDKWHQATFLGTSRKHRDLLQHIKEGDKGAAIDALRADIEGFVIN